MRVVYVGLDCGFCSKGVHLMGNEQSMVMVWISYSLSNRNNVMVMGDVVNAWCLSLGGGGREVTHQIW